MDNDTYLILRVTATKHEAFDPLREYNWRSEEPAKLISELEYQVAAQTLDIHDYQEARRDPEVQAIAPLMPLRLIEPVAAPEPSVMPEHVYGATWGVFVTGALQSPYVGHGACVAVLDTGIDADHEAFRGLELIQKDFTGEGNGDQHGHGTHVAGTIFGQTVGGLRYGVAPGVRRALIGKVLGKERASTTKELVDAINWAVDQGAHVINMSLRIDFPGLVEAWVENGLEVDLATSKALVQYRDNVRLFDRLVDVLRNGIRPSPGVLTVAATGNESKRQVRPDYAIDLAPPAAAKGVVAVAALRSAGPPHETLTVAPFSNTGAALAAPGMGIYSAQKGGGYTSMDGTSMASPHVTGVAALWAERQIQRNGVVNISALDAQVRGHARRDRLPGANYLDVGEGLVAAPQD